MTLFDSLDQYTSSTAVVTNRPGNRTFKELLSAADEIGKRIENRCLVFTLCSNGFESLAGYVGLMRAKSVQVLLSSGMADEALMKLLDTYRPAYLFLPTEKAGLTGSGRAVHVCGGYTLLKTDYGRDYTLHEDLALLLSTSGSTGSPKMVRQSHHNLRANTESIIRYLDIQSEDRPITTMPMNYSYGLSIINSHLVQGASLILSDLTLMDRGFWEIVKNERVTTFGGVPFIYEMLKRLRFERMDLPDLKYLTQAGGKLSQELTSDFAAICRKKKIEFIVMYGQTEATARMAYLSWDHMEKKAGSIGRPIPGGAFWLEDEQHRVIKDCDTVGELVYRGENVAMGYAENRFDLAKEDDNQGILQTGDLARQDPDGFYYITGRKKRFLKIYGNRVNLDEIERMVKASGFECACTGTDDHLQIYLTDEEEINPVLEQVTRRTGINRAGFSCLVIDEIPRNESGKILYSVLGREVRGTCHVG